MDLIKAFEEIDTDYSGEITKDELTSYMVKKDYETNFVNVSIIVIFVGILLTTNVFVEMDEYIRPS